jgi:hypothetical protein
MNDEVFREEDLEDVCQIKVPSTQLGIPPEVYAMYASLHQLDCEQPGKF